MQTKFATFVFGRQVNGTFVLTCLDDGQQFEFASREKMVAFAETYQPKMHELN